MVNAKVVGWLFNNQVIDWWFEADVSREVVSADFSFPHFPRYPRSVRYFLWNAFKRITNIKSITITNIILLLLYWVLLNRLFSRQQCNTSTVVSCGGFSRCVYHVLTFKNILRTFRPGHQVKLTACFFALFNRSEHRRPIIWQANQSSAWFFRPHNIEFEGTFKIWTDLDQFPSSYVASFHV